MEKLRAEPKEAPKWRLVCQTCGADFTPKIINFWTRMIAERQAVEHANFYHPPHCVVETTFEKCQ